MYFPLDAADTPVHSGLGHIKFGCNLHQRAGPDPQVEHRQLLRRKIALRPEIRTFRFRKLRFDVQGGITPFS
jgi:hypothetical protein